MLLIVDLQKSYTEVKDNMKEQGNYGMKSNPKIEETIRRAIGEDSSRIVHGDVSKTGYYVVGKKLVPKAEFEENDGGKHASVYIHSHGVGKPNKESVERHVKRGFNTFTPPDLVEFVRMIKEGVCEKYVIIYPDGRYDMMDASNLSYAKRKTVLSDEFMEQAKKAEIKTGKKKQMVKTGELKTATEVYKKERTMIQNLLESAGIDVCSGIWKG